MRRAALVVTGLVVAAVVVGLAGWLMLTGGSLAALGVSLSVAGLGLMTVGVLPVLANVGRVPSLDVSSRLGAADQRNLLATELRDRQAAGATVALFFAAGLPVFVLGLALNALA